MDSIKNSVILIWILFSFQSFGQTIDDLRLVWRDKYAALNVPSLQLDYQAFLNAQCQADNLVEQAYFFQSDKKQLTAINVKDLTPKDRFDYHLIKYETDLNLERIALIRNTSGAYKVGGIYDEPNGVAWYSYLIKHWTSTDITPEEVTTYGWEEVRRIQTAMKVLESTYDISKDSTSEEKVVEIAFEEYEQFLEERVWTIVPHWFTPELKVQRGTNPNLSQVPGYYGGNTIFYNLFNDPFDLSQIGWLYLHEGVPGHHFQLNSENRADIPTFRQSTNYSGFREGWAAYVEELAHEQNWYETPAQKYSQMEWDLIRSIRLVLDVGLNYDGWSDEKALEVWQSAILDADPIGLREIARMRRWPAQVLTYKIGARVIMETRNNALGADRSANALRAFHARLLSKASIPMALVPMLFEAP